MSNLLGRTVAGYRILEELGRGGMGVVYKAEELVLGRIVALKVLQGGLSNDGGHLQRFRQEALAAARLNHPNIVTIYAIAFEEDMPLIAMEYIDGVELSRLIHERGALDLELALRIGYRVASALHASHAQGIIHRDIKPQNIMIDRDNRVRVLDFGIAKMVSTAENLTDTGSILGTPAFMAPEYFRGEAIDEQTDIYALGIVMYQMLTGRLPFEASVPATVIQRILNEQPPRVDTLNPAVPRPLVDAIQRAIAKDKKDRFRTAAEFEAVISKILFGLNSRTQQLQMPTLMLDSDALQVEAPRTLKSQVMRLYEQLPASPRARIAGIAGVAALLMMILVLVLAGPDEEDAARQKRTADAASTEAASKDESQATGEDGATRSGAGSAGRSRASAQRVSARATLRPIGLADAGLAGDRVSSGSLEAAAAFSDSVRKALMSYTGLGGEVDEAGAREEIDRLAKQGDAAAAAWKAWFLHWGRCGFVQDREVAAALMEPQSETLREIINAGSIDAASRPRDGLGPVSHADALFLLGAALDQGMGLEADEAEAFRLVKQAADLGHTPAITYLGWMHVEGRGTEPDAKLGYYAFLRAAHFGDVSGMHNLGWMYATGSGIDQNDEQALNWFRRGAFAGSARNMANLAWLHQQGRGVPQSAAEALRWMRAAAEGGDHRSMYNLGVSLETGYGAEPDTDEALQWFQRAAELGNSEAREKLRTLSKG